MSSDVTILTYNIHKGFGPGKISFHLPKMHDALLGVGSDIILLQEVQGEHKRQEKIRQAWPLETQFEFLAGKVWPHVIYAKNAVYQSGHHGNAILSKYDIQYWENVDVSNSPRVSRSFLHSQMLLPNYSKSLHVICVHFGLFKAERHEQIQQLLRVIEDRIPSDEPLIIAGDFNDWRGAITDQIESHFNLKEVFREIYGDYAKSFPAWHAALTLDRIYYRGLKIKEATCLNTKPWRSLSDHLPLWAKFELV